jgi:beta-glucanase (GH16 family)
MKHILLVILLINLVVLPLSARKKTVLPVLSEGSNMWELKWQDEFDYPNRKLDKQWEAQNGPNTHILCSRWRENVEVKDGYLRLINKKENRGGQEWTSGSIWTKEQFQYGYYECRYRYAAAPATNNSFWLMTRGIEPKKGKKFEIDINEGHYPNKINTNIHNWSDFFYVNGKRMHPTNSKSYYFGVQPDVRIQLETPVVAHRVRFRSNNASHFNIREFRIYGTSSAGYPDIFGSTTKNSTPIVSDYARDKGTTVRVSGTLSDDKQFNSSNLIDGNPETRWVSQREGEKWIEFEFESERTIGCVDFINGWYENGSWKGLITDYLVEYHNGKEWLKMASFDLKNGAVDFARDFHVYGLDWSEEELTFYFDGKEIRREKNEFCHSPSPVWLSLAIIAWAGNVTDAIDGTFMEVDYVRIFQRKNK